MSTTEPSTEKLVNDLKTVVRDAEELIKVMASDMGATTQAAKEKLSEALDSAKHTYQDLEAKAAEGAKVADEFVQKNPYRTMGVAFGIGVLLGALCSRK